MNIVVTGRGTSGSFQIRGQQLGAAIGARVEADATDFRGVDLAVIVKRAQPHLLARLRAAKTPIVYDIVDGWPQPIGNEWNRALCMDWLRTKVAEIRPIALVAATRAMATDCSEFGLPVLALPHHARPQQKTNPIRTDVYTVGYEGGEQYIGKWRPQLESLCNARGWEFVINPPSLSDVDIVVAVRDATGYAPRHWKSNVKLANAQATGTPCIVNREAGNLETRCGGECFADSQDEVSARLSELTSWEARKAAHDCLLQHAPKLEDVAAEYKKWLRQLNS